MKKYILVIIGIFLLAGLVFATTNTDFLQGNFGDRTPGAGGQSLPGGGGLAITGGAAGNTNNTTTSGAIDGEDGTDTGYKNDDELIIGGVITTTGTGGFKPTEPKDDDEDEVADDKVVLDGASTGAVKDSVDMESTEDKAARDSQNALENSIRGTSVISTVQADNKVNNESQIRDYGIVTNSGSKEVDPKANDQTQAPREAIASEFFVYLEVLDENGRFVSGLDEDDFNPSKEHKEFKEQTSFYSFEYKNGINIKYSIDLDGYDKAYSEQVTAVPSPREAELIQLEKEAEPAACTSLEIQAYAGATLQADENEKESEIGVTFSSNSELFSGTIKITNDNNTDFNYTESSYAHNKTTSEIQFFINNQKEGDIDFNATFSPGATFTATVMGEESTCTDSFTVSQLENVQQVSAPIDTDLDGVPDESDNCPANANTDQSDIDADGIGDICDPQNDSLPPAPEQDETPAQEEYYEVTPDVEQPEYKTGEIFSCEHGFADIMNTKNEATICWLAQEGVVNGKSASNFGYTENITVAEYLKVLLILAGESPSNGRSSFTNGSHWGEGWLVRAEELDVLRARDGFPANVNHPITRADAALYAMRLIQETYYPTSSPYTDVETNDYFGYAVIYLSELTTNIPQEGTRNVLEGYEDARFKPYSYINRGEAMSLLTGMFFSLFQ